jgi:polyphosphate kinase
MVAKYQYFNRDLSWLSFNYRVLEVAKDSALPLFERIKFLAIYSSNLDEFYKVRVAAYRSSLEKEDSGINKRTDVAGILKQINQEVGNQLNEFGGIFKQDILPGLQKIGINLLLSKPICNEHLEFTEHFFHSEVLPYLQPMLLSAGKILTFLQDNVLYLLVKMYRKTNKTTSGAHRRSHYALIKVPTNYLPRFIELPEIDGVHYVQFLDDVIRYNLHHVFPGYEVDSCYSIKLSRDADLMIEDEADGNLVEKVRQSLSRRKTGNPSRLLYDSDMPEQLLKVVQKVFDLSYDDFVPGARYHNFSDFLNFPNPFSPNFELPVQKPLRKRELEGSESIFKSIKIKDQAIFFPYHRYDYVLRFLNEAGADPDVEEIKITQYRLAKNSAIVSALINAQHNGKQVTVFVEVKARFDEEMNLYYLNEMKRAGIKIISSIPGLKVHAKTALVIRHNSLTNEKEGYAFLSTGNFNEKTARIYSDVGLFTANPVMVAEVGTLFTFLENPELQFEFKQLLIGQFNMRKKIKELIRREISNAESGKKAYMILKMNSLEDKKIIDLLYQASEKGVKIDLIIRGICCLVPQQPYSQNITVRRIVDRYLEHSRTFIFYNNGANDTFISSADMMKRNLYNRVETTVPIYEPEIKRVIYELLQIQLSDNSTARFIDNSLNNVPVVCEDNEVEIRSQYAIYNFLKSIGS